MKAEFTTEEWKVRPAALRHRRAVHDCDGNCGGVFKCRAHGGYHACGRFVGYCHGGDDNRCANCWTKWLASLKRRLAREIALYGSCREDSLCKRLGNGTGHDTVIEDALFELVREGKIEWFGAENSLSAPMRYRIRGRST